MFPAPEASAVETEGSQDLPALMAEPAPQDTPDISQETSAPEAVDDKAEKVEYYYLHISVSHRP